MDVETGGLSLIVVASTCVFGYGGRRCVRCGSVLAPPPRSALRLAALVAAVPIFAVVARSAARVFLLPIVVATRHTLTFRQLEQQLQPADTASSPP